MHRKAMHFTFEIDGPATQSELHHQAERIVKHIMDNGILTDTLNEEATFGAVLICTTDGQEDQSVYLFCSNCGSQTAEFKPSGTQWENIKSLPFWLTSFELEQGCLFCQRKDQE